jgi:hypothetical protein
MMSLLIDVLIKHELWEYTRSMRVVHLFPEVVPKVLRLPSSLALMRTISYPLFQFAVRRVCCHERRYKLDLVRKMGGRWRSCCVVPSFGRSAVYRVHRA